MLKTILGDEVIKVLMIFLSAKYCHIMRKDIRIAIWVMIIINSERIAEIVIYALIILAVLFLYMYPIYTVVNHKKKSGYGLPMPYYLTHIVIDRLTIPV